MEKTTIRQVTLLTNTDAEKLNEDINEYLNEFPDVTNIKFIQCTDEDRHYYTVMLIHNH